MLGIGKFVFLPSGTAVVNTLAETGSPNGDLILTEAAVALIDAADPKSVSFSILLFRNASGKGFLREEVAFHTLVAQPLANFKTFATFQEAIRYAEKNY
ncbi:MAG: hypothetical protein AAB486_00640 [Patescibacteria group bacterium]